MTQRVVLQNSLVALCETLPSVQVQNRLMATTDRDLAVVVEGMTDEQVESILGRVSTQKARRVREEMHLQVLRQVEEKHKVFALQVVLASLQSERAIQGKHSYLRPRKPRSER